MFTFFLFLVGLFRPCATIITDMKQFATPVSFLSYKKFDKKDAMSSAWRRVYIITYNQ